MRCSNRDNPYLTIIAGLTLKVDVRRVITLQKWSRYGS